MPIEVEVPEGIVEFPDGTSQETIEQALADRNAPKIQPSPYEQADIRSMGAGLGKAETGMESGTSFTPALFSELPRDVGEGLGSAMKTLVGKPVAELINTFKAGTAGETGLQTGKLDAAPAAEAGVPLLKLPMAAPEEKGIVPSLSRFVEPFTTPEGIGTLPFAGFKAVQGLFGLQAAAAIPGTLQSLVEAKGGPGTRGALTDVGLNLAMTGLMGKALLKEKGGSKTVEPDPTPGSKQSIEHFGHEENTRRNIVAVAEGRKPFGTEMRYLSPSNKQLLNGFIESGALAVKQVEGDIVFSRPKTLDSSVSKWSTLRHEDLGRALGYSEKEIKEWADYPPSRLSPEVAAGLDELGVGELRQPEALPLSPDAAALLKAELHTIPDNVEIVGDDYVPPTDPNEPFARDEGIKYMKANRERGTVEVNGPAFEKVLQDVPEAQRAAWIRSALAEESIHLRTNDSAAKSYWGTITPVEQALVKKEYSGSFKGEAPGLIGMTDILWGHEALRMRMQRLRGMETTEVAKAALVERWTLKSLHVLETTIRGVREAMGTKASEEGKAIINELLEKVSIAKAAVANPSAYHRRPKVKIGGEGGQEKSNLDQGSLFSEPITAKGVPGAETIAQSERTSATEAGALPRITAVDLQKKATEHLAGEIRLKLTESKPGPIVGEMKPGEIVVEHRPSFAEFADWAKKNMEGVKPEQVRSLWEDAVWNELMKASPERLQEWAKALDAEAPERTYRMPPEGGFTTKGMKGAKERQAARSRMGQRPQLISRLAGKLIDEAMPKESLTRKTVEQDDIDFSSAKDEPFRELSKHEAADPKVLGGILRKGARRSSRDPVSATRRLVVLQDKRTGQVALVSAYPHGREGMIAVDPMAAGIKERPNAPLTDLLRRYRAVYGVLLKDPVQNFHQGFESLQDFNEHIGAAEAKRMAQAGDFPGEAAAAGEPFETPEGTEGLEGEGGTVMGPHADKARGYMGMGIGELERSESIPMTGSEAGAVLDYVLDEVGKIESHADMADAMTGLVDRAERGILHGRERSAISALQKAAQEIQREYQDYTPDQSYEKAIYEFYDLLTQNEGYEDYVQRTLGRFTQPPEQAVPIGAAPTGKASAPRELTMRERVPPTVVRPENVPPYAPAIERKAPPELTAGHPGDIVPPEMLSDVRSPFLAEQVKAESKALPSRYEALAKGPPKPVGEPLYYRKFNPNEVTVRPEPGAYHRTRTRLLDDMAGIVKRLGTIGKRRGSISDIYRLGDAANNSANLYAANEGEMIRNASMAEQPKHSYILGTAEARPTQQDLGGKGYKPTANLKAREQEAAMARGAAKHVIAARFEPINKKTGKGIGKRVVSKEKFDEMLEKVNVGRAKAEEMMNDASRVKRWIGRKWLRNQEILKAEIEYARDNYKSPVMRATVAAVDKALADHLQYLRDNGVNVNEREDYVPGRYQGDVWDGEGISFGKMRIGGTNFRAPKVFENYAQASMYDGPYLMASPDIADLVENSVAVGRRRVARNDWMRSLTAIRDEVTKKPIARNPDYAKMSQKRRNIETGEMVDTEGYVPVSPSKDYEIVHLGDNHQAPIAVLPDYARHVKAVFKPSSFPDWGYGTGQTMLELSSILKHGVVLVGDFFHPGRLAQYGAAAGGKGPLDFRTGYKGGVSALRYHEADLPRAVELGRVSKEAADWALEKINVGGMKMSRLTVAHDMIAQGLNAARIHDALYRDAVQRVPLIGETWHKLLAPMNRWIFDNVTSGLMVETAVRNFDRMHEKYPNVPYRKLMKLAIRDTNTIFGNLGRQGIFRDATFRDFAQVFLLAPLWQEGLIMKELTTYSRAANMAGRLARGKSVTDYPYLGVTGRMMVRGLASYFALTQLMNLITRQQFTWQNKEKGHKLDAWIPTGKETGIWINPMSVFMEKVSEIIRINEHTPTIADALMQNGANALGPMGKAGMILASGKTGKGEQTTSTAGRIGEAAKELAPLPISFGSYIKAGAHAVAPGLVGPTRPGEFMQRTLSMVGVKGHLSETATSQMMSKAGHFVEHEGLQKSKGWLSVQTTEPSYTKLRAALRNEDSAEAQRVLTELLKTHKESEVGQAMSKWTAGSFTGSKKNEQFFIDSLSKDDQALYSKAQQEKQAVYDRFLKELSKHEEQKR